ncbi:MAG: AIR synthase related protein, partial [Candidatus Cloacimonetes bacterium]|nr:AIR synthase related protein [Candidatus Cloacimonadota bacterium]
DMNTYEIMLSESQERMLVIVQPENIARVLSIFEKWDLDAVQIGSITDDKMLRVKNQGVVEAEIPAEYLILGGKAPVYTRESKRPEYLNRLQKEDLSQLNLDHDHSETLLKLLASPNIASKRHVFSQYDHMVGISTTVEPGSDAAVIRIRESDKAIAASTDCNGRYCYLDPYEGTKAAVAEAARNVACSGAKPIAISNCLNFGNPYKPEVYYGFKECIKGMKNACLAFDTPVTGGNVSFYNENPEGAIYPTPVIAMLGLMQDFRLAQTQYFKAAGDKVFLLGPLAKTIGGSEYLKVIHHKVAGLPPRINLALEKRVQDTVIELNEARLIHSAHDLSEGGLAIALAESCFHPEQTFGFKGKISHSQAAAIAYFGESGANIIISAASQHQGEILTLAKKHSVELYELGEVTLAQSFIINDDIAVSTLKLREAYETGLKM